jgi:hypothetical protein
MAVNVANMIGTGVFLKTRVMTCNVGSAKAVHGTCITAVRDPNRQAILAPPAIACHAPALHA